MHVFLMFSIFTFPLLQVLGPHKKKIGEIQESAAKIVMQSLGK